MLAVKVPAALTMATAPGLAGQGEAASIMPAGDLYVEIHIKSHPVFQRDGDDLHCEMPVSFTTAALGGEIEIPTLDGMARIRVPTETQSGGLPPAWQGHP